MSENIDKSIKQLDSLNSRADISLLRITATLGVLLIHTCNPLTNNPSMYVFKNKQMELLTSVVVLSNWAVSVFFMITSALMLNGSKKVTYKEFITKYVRRLVFALYMFGVPFSMLDIFYKERTI